MVTQIEFKVLIKFSYLHHFTIQRLQELELKRPQSCVAHGF